MKGGELFNDEGKQGKEHCLLLTTMEARTLYTVVEEAAEKKIKGSKALIKKLNQVLHCF